MNNNLPAILRSLIVYAVCVPLAVWVGFLAAQQWDRSTFSVVGVLALVLFAPLLLRWHHFLLIVSWNLGMTIFFLPGSPQIWLFMVALSLGVSVLHRTLNSEAQFIPAPRITWPLIFLTTVVVFTIVMTGGIGLHSLGNEVSGGRNYILLLVAILGYFALTAQRIPPHRAGLYISLFFLAGCVSVVGDLAAFVPSSLYFIFAFFPVSGYDLDRGIGSIGFHARYAGLGNLGMMGFLFMMARYGVRGIFLSGKLWRLFVFAFFTIAIFFGGFRSTIILCGLAFLVQFFMERIHRTRAFPVFIFCGLIAVALIVPFANKLPYTFQRALAFLPLNIDRAARADAEGTKDWRLQIWKDTLPLVPKYLLLGKGYALSQLDLQAASSQSFHYLSDAEAVGIVGNYHSGPFSVVIPFGIWGAIAIIWFWIASIRALYDNHRYGDPALRNINIFLFAYFIARVFLFLVVFGGLYGDMPGFIGIIGLSVSLNGGIRRPAIKSVQTVAETPIPAPAQPRFHPYFQR